MLWLVETMLWLMGGFWGVCSVALFSVDTPEGGIVTFLLMALAFALGSRVRSKRKAKKEAKEAKKKARKAKKAPEQPPQKIENCAELLTI